MSGLSGEGQLKIQGVDTRRPNKLSPYKHLPAGVVATEFFTLEQGGDLLEIHWLERGQVMTPKKRAIIRAKMQAHNGHMDFLEIWRLNNGWADLRLVYSRLGTNDQLEQIQELQTDLPGLQQWIHSWFTHRTGTTRLR